MKKPGIWALHYFPTIDLEAVVAQAVQVAYDRHTSAAIRQLRQHLNQP